MKSLRYRFVIIVCWVAPWFQLGLLWLAFSQEKNDLTGAYQQVLEKYQAVYPPESDDKLANYLIMHLGRVIEDNITLIWILMMVMVFTLPLNFLFCHFVKKHIRELSSRDFNKS